MLFSCLPPRRNGRISLFSRGYGFQRQAHPPGQPRRSICAHRTHQAQLHDLSCPPPGAFPAHHGGNRGTARCYVPSPENPSGYVRRLAFRSERIAARRQNRPKPSSLAASNERPNAYAARPERKRTVCPVRVTFQTSMTSQPQTNFIHVFSIPPMHSGLASCRRPPDTH
jgi:hypothetical protein